MKFRLQAATNRDIEDIVHLVNLAYRGDEGWTKETHLVAGNRTTADEIKQYLADSSTYLFVGIKESVIVSCVCIEALNDDAYIGLLTVHPELQGKGIGKQVLNYAEQYALEHMEIEKYIMVVVSQRPELIEYYERCGYQRTGRVLDYPAHLNVGTPLRDNLTVEYLEKVAYV